MPRARGLGSLGQQRASQNIQNALSQAAKPVKPPRATPIPSSQAYMGTRTDFGPWFFTPGSSRVEAYRYDYLNDSIQVRWKNRIRAQSGPSSPTARPTTTYGLVANGTPIDYEMFRRFARSASLGKAVNTLLNGWGYRGVSVDEDDAASNGRRSGGGSRFKGSTTEPSNYQWP